MIKKESKFKEISNKLFLTEISYDEYKRDESRTAKQKVNEAISNVNSTLLKLERALKHNIKLTKESFTENDKVLWRSTEGKLAKIHERISNIFELVQKIKTK